MRVTGRSGSLKIGPAVAARFGAWTLSGNAKEWTVETDVVSADPFLLDQHERFTLALQFPTTIRQWRDVGVRSRSGAHVVLVGAGEPEKL